MKTLLSVKATFAICILMAFAPLAANADDAPVVAAMQYDVVSYFGKEGPKKGSEKYQYLWEGEIYFFESAANRELFIASPEKYAPQFKGNCAFAAAQGEIATGNAEVYEVINDKLYFFGNDFARTAWLEDQNASLEKADRFWEHDYKKSKQPQSKIRALSF